MNKRLTIEQKYFAICVVLRNASYPLTARAIGREIGFANGIPVQEIVRDLAAAGLLKEIPAKLLGKTVIYYWLTEEGRGQCEDFLLGRERG